MNGGRAVCVLTALVLCAVCRVQSKSVVPRDVGECVEADLSVALDCSGSVDLAEWSAMLDFTRGLLKRLQVSPQCTQVALLGFGNKAYLYSHLDEHGSAEDVNAVISTMPYLEDWMTNMAAVFTTWTSEVFVSTNGDRADVPNVAVLITDGISNADTNLTVPNAQAAREEGIDILTVGVGPRVNEAEMLSITGDVKRNVYVQRFADLLDQTVTETIAQKITEMTFSETPDTFTWSCTFEDSHGAGTWCDVTQVSEDQFDWSLGKGATPSDLTGPDAAESGEFYIYMEASGRQPRDQARLELPPVPRDGAYCLRFAYHMYGWHIDTLSVVKHTQDGGVEIVWSEHGDHGNQWLHASVDVDLRQHESLLLIAERGEEYSGDIALDSVELREATCA